jgi:hypothetical protein
MTVELVPGLEIGEDMFSTLLPTSARSTAFLFLEEGRTRVDRSGLPSASPVAAMPTVLEATSWEVLAYMWFKLGH